MSDKPIICWFRQDLRLADNPALAFAADSGKPVVALYIHDELSPGIRPMGAAQKWWLHYGLADLADNLNQVGNRLILRSGAAADVVADVIEDTGADAIVWNRRYGAAEQTIDAEIEAAHDGARSFDGVLMHQPGKVRTGSGKPYKVYSPFWKNLAENLDVRDPLPAPTELEAVGNGPATDDLDDWKFLPTKPDWSGGIVERWRVGEEAAHERADAFLSEDLRAYDVARDDPGADRTSRMSPYLRHGHISPHQLWHKAQDGRRTADPKARETYVKELVWREFSYHLLHNFKPLHEENFNAKFDNFDWRDDPESLRAWQRGQTGYPIVDAGMRQLWHTGWMHNRVRMICASFLVKHLLIDWREGERWFWDTLVDGDPASNPAQWQWVAGTGADAAPFFRIFNPILQATKFDPDGIYIKHFVPELENLPNKFLGAPWDAGMAVLEKAGVRLGDTYPRPIVDHKEARQRALDELATISGKAEGLDA